MMLIRHISVGILLVFLLLIGTVSGETVYEAVFTPSSDGMLSYGAHNTSALSTLRNAATGSSADISYAYCHPRVTAESSPTEEWYFNYRCAYLFDISSIPDNAVNITSELDLLKYYRVSTLSDFGIAPVVFNIDGALDTADYNNFDYVNVSIMKTVSSMTDNKYYNWSMNKTMNDHIGTKLAGTVGVGLLHQPDITGVAPTWASGGSTYASIRTVDNVTDIPYLRVWYSLPVKTYPVNITDSYIVANSDTNLPSSEGLTLNISATAGEVTHGYFVIKAPQALTDVSVNASTLVNETGGTMPSSSLNITTVVDWFQSPNNYTYTTYISPALGADWRLTPEPKFFNRSLVRVGIAAQTNDLWVENGTFTGYKPIDNRSTSGWMKDYKIIDTPSANGYPIPFGMFSGENVKVSVRVKVPDGTPPGNYSVKLGVNSTGTWPRMFNLTVWVLPFTLVDNTFTHNIYNVESLNSAYSDTPAQYTDSQYAVTEGNYTIMLQNLKDHGVLHPSVETGTSGCTASTETMLDLRDALDFPTDMLFLRGYNYAVGSANQSNTAITNAVNMVDTCIAMATTHGYSEVYFYGRDEPTAEQNIYDRVMYENITAHGGKIYQALSTNLTVHNMDDYVAMPVSVNESVGTYPWVPSVDGTWLDIANRNHSHAAGNKILAYSNPQSAIEYPQTYRRNYGLLLPRWDFDGGMPYQWYRHQNETVATLDKNSTWNEYHRAVGTTGGWYKPGGMVYPLFGGYTNTLQWDEYGEGTVDQQYYLTLVDVNGGDEREALDTINAGIVGGTPMQDIRANLTRLILEHVDAPPEAAFSGTPVSGTEPKNVTFTDSSLNDPTSWLWEFSNATVGWTAFPGNSTTKNPDLILLPAGTYNIRLTATNAYGPDIETKTGYVVLAPSAVTPVAAMSISKRIVLIPQPVVFTDLSTGSPTLWNWSFGDGRWQNGTSATTTHSYSRGGFYQAYLLASNIAGSDESVRWWILAFPGWT
jgi:PKD repeat protein